MQASLPASTGLQVFLEKTEGGTLRTLSVLSAAESLTDWLAQKLTTEAGLSEQQSDSLVEALRYCGFTVERNSEWHITQQARVFLQEHLLSDPDLHKRIHRLLFSIATSEAPRDENREIPAYLSMPAGIAYHQSVLDQKAGLAIYAQSFNSELTGDQWLLARLATEQQLLGILPVDAIEPAFLAGMLLYKEGRYREAERRLKTVASSRQHRTEVAIAAHLVGRLMAKRFRRQDAESFLRHSLSMLVELGDKHGEAQVLHTLGTLIIKSHPIQAEQYLRRSVAMLSEMKDKHGVAQVLHDLGRLVAKRDPAEAEQLLRESLGIGEQIGHRHHQAQVLHDLGRLVAKRDSAEAERLLRESLAKLIEMKDKPGVAQVLDALGRLIATVDQSEALVLLRRSLDINRELGLSDHVRRQSRLIAKIESR